MEDFFDQDEAKAIVYLLSEGDNNNKVIISDDQLLVIRKNHKKLILLKSISILKSENKKLLFPLILGGIVTPFAFLSNFTNLFHPLIHLISILGGMFLFYIGWIGKSAFTIVFKNGDEADFYLPSISKNLQAFIDFVNTLQTDTGDSSIRNLLFFEVEKEHEEALFGTSKIIKNKHLFPLFGFTYRQLKLESKSFFEENIIAINPIKAGREIKFSFDLKSNKMRPKLEGPVSAESKVNISDYQ